MPSLIVVVALLSTVNSCKQDNPDPVPTLTFATPTLSCQVGSSAACSNVATSSIPSGGAVSYSISNTAVATINASTGAVTR
ncbi:MAG: hypothetical protein WDO15_29275 [Bacteroidota bacterium]